MQLARMGGVSLAISLALVACNDDETSPQASPVDPVVTPRGEAKYFVLVSGTLNAKDRGEQKRQHDALAKGGEESAKKAGDVGHDVFLGSGLLGSQPEQFIALDRWIDASKIEGFYSDPAFAKGFGQLITPKGPPEIFVKDDRFHTWGTLDAGNGVAPHYWTFVRARLQATDPALQKEAHDTAAKGGEQKVRAVGDVAHIVFTGVKDAREFLAIDVWTSKDAIVAVYTDPDFQKALAPVFDGQPSVTVGESTDWHQW